MNKAQHIRFHRPTQVGGEDRAIQKAVQEAIWFRESEDCHQFFHKYFPESRFFFTNSCSCALEMAVRALGIGPGDEVIIPGFAYLAVANAVVNNGATPVYTDVLLNGNLDVNCVAGAVSKKTKAVIAIHYAGNPFDVTALLKLCEDNHIYLIEDAAQCIGSTYHNKPLGSFGHLACLSFDYMKNITCGQGGLLIVNDEALVKNVQTVTDNGADKDAMMNGSRNYFDWGAKGNNGRINPLATYFLSVQLGALRWVTENRLRSWNLYGELLSSLEKSGRVILPNPETGHNGHIYYVLLESEDERNKLRNYLRENEIFCEHHYSSLSHSPFGRQFAQPGQALKNSEKLCEGLLRLPVWHDISVEDIDIVATTLESFYVSQLSGRITK